MRPIKKINGVACGPQKFASMILVACQVQFAPVNNLNQTVVNRVSQRVIAANYEPLGCQLVDRCIGFSHLSAHLLKIETC